MSRKQVYTLGGVVSADDANAGSSIVLRDSGGNIAGSELIGTGLNSSGKFTLGATESAKTSTFTVDDTRTWWEVDATGGAVTANLPAASASAGKVYIITRINGGSNAVTLDGNGSETINGATTLVLSAQWKSVMIRCNGTSWTAFISA